MKKILSFVLVLAMVLGSVSMAFAKTETFSDVKGLSCEEAVNVLAGLGVVSGYPDGEFKPARNITRAEAVKLIIGALAMPVDEKGSYETPFTDVPANAWYAGYVLYANKLGITKGTSETQFSPDAMVTSDQMIAFTMRALGYTEAVLQGEYPACFINKAVGLKVLNGVSTGSQAAPRGEIAQLIYNCLTKQIGSVGADGMWHGAQIADDISTREKTDNMLNRLGAVEDAGFTLVTEDEIEDALVDLNSYHGAVVKFYRTQEEGDIVAVSEIATTFVTAKESEGKLGGYKIDLDLSKASLTRTIRDNDNDKTVREVPTVKIENGEDVNFNNPIDTSKKLTYAVEIKGGRIVAIYSSQKWDTGLNTSEIMQITADDLDDLEEEEPTLGASKFPLDDDDKLDYFRFTVRGAKSLDSIKIDDVVYVYADSEGIIRRVDVSDATAKGEFTRIRGSKHTNDDDDYDKYTIGGTAYELAKYAHGAFEGVDPTAEGEPLNKDSIGKEYTVYLGYDGKIAFIDGEGESSSDYAVFLKFWDAADGNANYRKDGIPGLDIFGVDGKEELYFADAYINDEGKIVAKGKGDALNAKTFAAGTLVKISRNSDGEVDKIVAFENDVEAKVTNKGRVVDENDTILAALGAKSVIFNYSGTLGDEKELAKAKNYSVIAASKLYGKDASFAGYDKDTDKKTGGYVLGALVEKAGSDSNDYVILTAKLSTINKNGNIEATVFMDGASKTLEAKTGTFKTYEAPDPENENDDHELDPISVVEDIYIINEVDANGVVKKATKIDPEDGAVREISLSTDSSIKVRVENDVVFAADDAEFEIEDGAVFYLYDISDDKWSIVNASALKGLYKTEEEKANKGVEAWAIKTDADYDGYDIFVIVRW